MADHLTVVKVATAGGAPRWKVWGAVHCASTRERFAIPSPRVRRFFRSRQDAEDWRGNVLASARTAQSWPVATWLTEAQVRDAEAATRILDGASLIPAATAYAASMASDASRTAQLDDLLGQMVDDMASAGRSPYTVDSLRRRVRSYLSATGAQTPSDITREGVARWLASMPGLSPVTRRNYRRELHTFAAWLVRGEYLPANPVAATAPIKVDEPDPAISAPAAVEDLLRCALRSTRPQVATYFATCYFGGLRPWEARRLRWDDVDMDAGQILVRKAKTGGGARVVPILPALRGWLDHAMAEGWPPARHTRHSDRAAREATDATHQLRPGEYRQDTPRHTFGTYWLAADPARTVAQLADIMGNSPGVCRAHYLRPSLGLGKAAKAFWGIRFSSRGVGPHSALGKSVAAPTRRLPVDTRYLLGAAALGEG